MEKIGIDLDEVVVDFVSSFLNFYNQKYKKNISINDLKSYDLSEVGIGKNIETSKKFVDEFFHNEESDRLSLVDGVRSAIIKLSLDHQLYIITARSIKYQEKTKRFIQKYFSKTPFEIIHSGDVYKEQGRTKADICNELDLIYFIEDHLKYAFQCSGISTRVFLLDKPWNQGAVNGNITRVKSWEEILEKIY